MSTKHSAELVLLVEDVAVRRYLIGRGQFLIGRSNQADIQIDDNAVSSQHALLISQSSKDSARGVRFSLEDLDSTNGTYVRGKRIVRTDLESGDIIRVGLNRFRFLMAEPVVTVGRDALEVSLLSNGED